MDQEKECISVHFAHEEIFLITHSSFLFSVSVLFCDIFDILNRYHNGGAYAGAGVRHPAAFAHFRIATEHGKAVRDIYHILNDVLQSTGRR